MCASALALLTLVGLAGCGSGAGTTETNAGTDSAAGGGLVIDLRFSLDPDGPGGEPARTKRITCTKREDSTDCGLGVPMVPKRTPPDQACTQIYGGPEVLRITGHYGGKRVDAKLTRANGCEIKRFQTFVPLLENLFPGYEPGSAIGA